MNKSTLIKHSLRIAGHATSVSLEAAFWDALSELAARRGVSVSALVASVDAGRAGNLSSAVRLFVLECCRRGELSAGGAASDASVASPGGQDHAGAQQPNCGGAKG